MVIDTSAIIAILNGEPGQERLERAIGDASIRLMSAGSAIEASIVVLRQTVPAKDGRAFADLDAVVESLGISIEPATSRHVLIARDAYAKFGKGIDAASLNFGNCLSYALAKETGEPLLFTGGDFAQTDVAVAEW